MKPYILKQRKEEITLNYTGKELEEDILNKISPVPLDIKYRPKQATLTKSHNMLVFGDNLPVLKTLTTYDWLKGKVKLIYIDPPFATGRLFNGVHDEEIAYSDTLKGGDFIEFLRKRLLLLKEILANDGSIYVHIDWKMSHYVRVLMDEIFGPEHFINDITRIKCNPKNFQRPAYGNIKDTILFYSKGDKYIWNGSAEKLTDPDIERLFPFVDEHGRRYTTNPLHAPGETIDGVTGQEWKGMKPPKGRHWRYPPEKLTELDEMGLIQWSKNGNPRKIIYANDAVIRGKKRQDIWDFKDPPYPQYPTEKNLEMMEAIIKASSSKGDFVLDAFCGSGTTIVAAEMLDRKWIGIDNSKVSIDTAIRRIRELENLSSINPYAVYEVRKQD